VIAAMAVPSAISNSVHIAKLCPGHQCLTPQKPMLDYFPKIKKCRCIAHPCWEDNGLAHACTNSQSPFLTFGHNQNGQLECACNSFSKVDSVFLSKDLCPGHKCGLEDFPVLDLDDSGQCVCRSHPCWDLNGERHACAPGVLAPVLSFRHDANGNGVCECKTMFHDPAKPAPIASEEKSRKNAKKLKHGFPMPPDTRPKGCQQIKEDFSQLTVSIVIPWLKEKWEHMEGTLKALLHMTPEALVKEFIFISDGNSDTKEAELKAISDKVRVLAFQKRVGLMVAKTKGVQMATAPVIVFMEAHCIVNRGWLEPLLQRLAQDPKSLAMPALDMIPEANFYEYHKTPPGYWRYEWNFNLINRNPGGGVIQDTSEPYMSPGTSGGIFAIRKDWFDHLGFFDEGMQQWGGDHMELTMKVWRCGGRIEIVPCSRVGHLFRTPQKRPYNVEVDIVVRNYARLARIWAGDYLEMFYKVKPEGRQVAIPDIAELKKKHDELGCEDMKWYLEHVDVEMGWEADKICIPGHPVKLGGCKRPAVEMFSTLDRAMPKKAYLTASAAAAEKRNRTARAHSAERGWAWRYPVKRAHPPEREIFSTLDRAMPRKPMQRESAQQDEL